MKITNNGSKPVTMPGGLPLPPGKSQHHRLTTIQKAMLQANKNLTLETEKAAKAAKQED